MTIIAVFTFILLPMLFLYNAEWKEENIKYLSTEQTTQMKGLFALLVVLVHFSQRMSNPGIMESFQSPGYLAVGGFFFLSGYGVYSSYLKNQEHLFRKTVKRIIYIYKPLVFITVIYLLISVFYFNERHSIIDILLNIMNIRQIDGITWYLLIMVYFYIIFYIAYGYFEKKNGTKVIFLLSLFYLIVAIYIKEKEIWWYNTTFLFYIGVIFKKKEEIIKKIFYKREIVVFLMGLILLAGQLMLFKDNVITQSIITIFFVLSFMILNFKIKYNSKVFTVLGIISYEIYLVHMKLFNIIFRENMFGRTGNLDFVLFFIGVLILATILYYIFNTKISKIQKLFIKENKSE